MQVQVRGFFNIYLKLRLNNCFSNWKTVVFQTLNEVCNKGNANSNKSFLKVVYMCKKKQMRT